MDQGDHLESKVCLEILDLMDQLVCLVREDLLVSLVRKERMVRLVFLVSMVLLVVQDLKENVDPLV